MNNDGFKVPELSDALKYNISPNMRPKNHYEYLEFTQSLTKVYITAEKKVYTRFTFIILSRFALCLHKVYMKSPKM